MFLPQSIRSTLPIVLLRHRPRNEVAGRSLRCRCNDMPRVAAPGSTYPPPRKPNCRRWSARNYENANECELRLQGFHTTLPITHMVIDCSCFTCPWAKHCTYSRIPIPDCNEANYPHLVELDARYRKRCASNATQYCILYCIRSRVTSTCKCNISQCIYKPIDWGLHGIAYPLGYAH